MRRAITGIALVIGVVCVGVPTLFHGGTGARAMAPQARPVVAPYHQESSVRAVRTAHGYRLVAPSH